MITYAVQYFIGIVIFVVPLSLTAIFYFKMQNGIFLYYSFKEHSIIVKNVAGTFYLIIDGNIVDNGILPLAPHGIARIAAESATLQLSGSIGVHKDIVTVTVNNLKGSLQVCVNGTPLQRVKSKR